MWDFIAAAAAEAAWIKSFGLTTQVAKAIRGRSKVTVKDIEVGPDMDIDYDTTEESESLEQVAALYDLQSRRLSNVANRVRVQTIGREPKQKVPSPAWTQVRLRLQQNVNDETLQRVQKGTPPDDVDALIATQEAIEAYRSDAVCRHLVIRKLPSGMARKRKHIVAKPN